MIRREAFGLGAWDSRPSCGSITVRVVSLPVLREHLRRAKGAAVVLLDERGLLQSDPEVLVDLQRRYRCLIGVLPGPYHHRELARLGESVQLTILDREGLAAWLGMAVFIALRPAVTPEDWMPPRPTAHGGSFEEALRLVPTLHELTVEEWAASIRPKPRTPRTLRRWFENLGLLDGPEDVIDRFLLALVIACRLRGYTWETVVHCTGYANVWSLKRGLRRLGVEPSRLGVGGAGVSASVEIVSASVAGGRRAAVR